METPRQLIARFLAEGRVVQLATAKNDLPWVCSVYYVVDNKLNVYWLSYASRRHSQNIAANKNLALTLVVKPDIPVVGVQAEGVATEVGRVSTVAKIMALYVKKYGSGENFYRNFILKKNKHSLYCFTPSRIVLFDELHFGPDNPQELSF